jgi:lysophospholipase L1-like esterase
MKTLTPVLYLCLLLLARAAIADPPLAITVGDSLVRDYPDYPCCDTVDIQGWGKEIRKYFRADLAWRNDAIGGSSTTTWLQNGYWSNTVSAHPRFILIMLGTNDFQDASHYADPETTYRQNLHQMITDALGIGAEPILVTPPPMRITVDGETLLEPDWLAPWAVAMREQAVADGVPLVELHDWLLAEYEKIGVPAAQASYGLQNPPGTEDRVHFSTWGADQAAQQIITELPADLAAFELPPVQPVPAFPYEPQ